MKNLNYIVLTVFSVIILIASIVVILLSIGWLDINTVGGFIEKAITGSKTHNAVFITSIVLALVSLIGIFFTDIGKSDKDREAGILMENGNGKLIISKTSLENLVESVVKEFESAEDIKTLIQIDENNNLKILVSVTVSKDVVIKELTVNIQNKIKEAIKKTSDLEVKEVNVKIKNISTQGKESK